MNPAAALSTVRMGVITLDSVVDGPMNSAVYCPGEPISLLWTVQGITWSMTDTVVHHFV